LPYDRLKGKKIIIETLGCRSNLYESEAIASALEALGAEIVECPPYDVAIINSCTVTQEADRKCRQLIRRLKRLSPEGQVIVCGCWAQKVEEREAKALGVRALVGNRKKNLIPQILASLFKETQEELIVKRHSLQSCGEWDDLFLSRPHFHTRAFVKVQDGCSRNCSYCIIPSVRGKSVSRPLENVVEEVQSLALNGCKEVVLTGIQLGFYGKDIGSNLANLVEALSGIKGIERIRFGSLEPFGLSRDLIFRLASFSKLCPHFHLPLQSGDDQVLEAMNRGYNSSDFAKVVGWFREAFGADVHIGTDIMVGFPGETEDMFNRSLLFVERLELGRLHVFPYSGREGTKAYSMKSSLTKEEVRVRVREAISLANRLLDKYARKWVGKNVPVLVEEISSGVAEGLTPHFLRVKLRSEALVVNNEVARVFIEGTKDGDLFGRIVKNK